MGGIPPLPDLKCFTLMATAGEEPDWNHVELSHRYRVIPMVNADFVKQFPMFSQLLHQFGVSTAFDVTPKGEWLVDVEEKTYNVFYVPDGLDNPGALTSSPKINRTPLRSQFLLQLGDAHPEVVG